MISYRKTKSLSERISESERILTKYPLSIPVIIETYDTLLIKNIKKNKFLVPQNVSVGHLIYSVRKQFELASNKGLFLFCDNKLLCGTTMMYELYEKYKEQNSSKDNYDKFLYITISTENTFG